MTMNKDGQTLQKSWVWLPPVPDPRSDDLPFMNSFTPTAVVSLGYVIGCYVWRQAIKRRRESEKASKPKTNGVVPASNTTKPQKWSVLQHLMVLYNAIMVVYSTVITVESLLIWISSGVGLGCGLYTTERTPISMRIVRVGWAFYFSKFVELLDTLFFLLRGKIDQVSFLHVFHHAAMPPSLWWGMRYSPAGILIMFPCINSFIHILMYTYYGLAAAGAYKYLWWKEYLTMAQMIQFLIMIIHQAQVFIPGSTCTDPRIFPFFVIVYSVLFFLLFGNFYVKAYWHKQRISKSHLVKSSTHINGKVKSH